MMDLQVARSYRSFGMRMSKNVARVNVVQFSLKLRIKKKKGSKSKKKFTRQNITSSINRKNRKYIRECKWIDLLIQ